ncbi:uncharacterized protein LOC144124567, partial [Amblyomma americanum]
CCTAWTCCTVLQRGQPRARPSRAFRVEHDHNKRKGSAAGLADPSHHAKAYRVAQDDVADGTLEPPVNLHQDAQSLLRLRTPPQSNWTTLLFPNVDGVFYATSRLEEENIERYHDKLVAFHLKEDGILCRTYIKGALHAERGGLSLEEAEEKLQEIDSFTLCCRALPNSQLESSGLTLTERLAGSLKRHGGAVYSNTCQGTVSEEGAKCSPCRAATILLLRRKYKLMAVAAAAAKRSIRHRERKTMRQRRLHVRVADLERKVKGIAKKNRGLPTAAVAQWLGRSAILIRCTRVRTRPRRLRFYGGKTLRRPWAVRCQCTLKIPRWSKLFRSPPLRHFLLSFFFHSLP